MDKNVLYPILSLLIVVIVAAGIWYLGTRWVLPASTLKSIMKSMMKCT